MIRTEVRFAPCKSSAVQGLRLASQRCRRCHTFIQHAPIYAIGLTCIHFAGIHPKDLTVLPYFHFANYNYEMWMEVPTMYYAQESNPTNIGRSKRTNPGLRPWPQKKNALKKPPPGRSPPLFTKDLRPASASFPCCRRRFARLDMEVSVYG